MSLFLVPFCVIPPPHTSCFYISLLVCLSGDSVRPSVHHVMIFYADGLTYCHNLFTNHSSFMSIKHLRKIPFRGAKCRWGVKISGFLTNKLSCCSHCAPCEMCLLHILLHSSSPCVLGRDQPNSREKNARFHDKVFKMCQNSRKEFGKFTGPTAVISRCYVNAN